MGVVAYAVFGGLSIHVSQGIMSHLLSADIAWSATAKEKEDTSFAQEMSKVLRHFKYTFIAAAVGVTLILVLALCAPPAWCITSFAAIWPLGVTIAGHVLQPILLNPGLMQLKW